MKIEILSYLEIAYLFHFLLIAKGSPSMSHEEMRFVNHLIETIRKELESIESNQRTEDK